MALWPDRPLIPDEWTDESGYHQPVVAAITEGFCPKHLGALRSPDAYCPSCDASWELTIYTGTIPTGGPYPRFAVSDGRTVLVSRVL
jgi:hypothetical protein